MCAARKEYRNWTILGYELLALQNAFYHFRPVAVAPLLQDRHENSALTMTATIRNPARPGLDPDLICLVGSCLIALSSKFYRHEQGLPPDPLISSRSQIQIIFPWRRIDDRQMTIADILYILNVFGFACVDVSMPIVQCYHRGGHRMLSTDRREGGERQMSGLGRLRPSFSGPGDLAV